MRHPNKVAWLIHQYRAAYELCGTAYSDFGHNESDVGLRDTLIRLDTEMLGECRRVFTQRAEHRIPAGEVQRASRRSRCIILRGSAPRLQAGPYGDYVLSVGRIESVKRVDLIVNAMAACDPRIRLIIAGDGTQRANVERLAEERGVTGRVTFLGSVADDDLVELYRSALAVIYPPFDEDFGYVTLEAFLARKPVVTCTDSGGPNEFVVDGENGFVCEPDAGGAGRRDQHRSPAIAAAPLRWVTPATTSRAESPGTASSRSSWLHSEPKMSEWPESIPAGESSEPESGGARQCWR